MPRTLQGPRRGRKKPVEPHRLPHILEWLVNGPHRTGNTEIDFIQAPTDEELLWAYGEFGTKLIATYKRKKSDCRIWCWWNYEAQRPRKQIKELPTDLALSSYKRQSLWFGIPGSFVVDGLVLLHCSQSLDEERTDSFTGLDVVDCIERFVDCFETQADYLAIEVSRP